MSGDDSPLMVSGGERGLSPLPSPMVRSGTRTYVLESERFGRGSVSNRSAAADAVRAFVVPFNSVSVVPARPASAFPALRSRCLRWGFAPLRPCSLLSGLRSASPPCGLSPKPASLSQSKTKAIS